MVGLDPVFLYATISWYMKRGRKERQCGMNTEPVHAKVNEWLKLHLIWQLRALEGKINIPWIVSQMSYIII